MKSEKINYETGEKYGEKYKKQNGEMSGRVTGEERKFVVESGARSLIFENRTQREWLSTEEAAHFLCLSPNALRIMVHRGQIQVFKLGRRLRFRVKDCQALFVKKGA